MSISEREIDISKLFDNLCRLQAFWLANMYCWIMNFLSLAEKGTKSQIKLIYVDFNWHKSITNVTTGWQWKPSQCSSQSAQSRHMGCPAAVITCMQLFQSITGWFKGSTQYILYFMNSPINICSATGWGIFNQGSSKWNKWLLIIK